MSEADSERKEAESDLQSLKQKYAKASGDLQDLRLQADEIRARNAELERKQKRYCIGLYWNRIRRISLHLHKRLFRILPEELYFCT